MRFAGFICFVLIAFAACCSAGAQENADDTLMITGRIHHYSYEDGFWGIEGDDGKIYIPERLTANFQVEDRKVKAEVRPITRKLLIKGWGTPVEILNIEPDRDAGK